MSETRPDPEDARYIKPTEIAKPNSHRYREEGEKTPRKEVQQITTGRTRKKSLGSRIKESLTGDDAQSVGAYLVLDVAVPAMQNLFVDAVQQGIERLIMGDSTPNRTRRASNRRTGYTSYNRYSGRDHRPSSTSPMPMRERGYSDRHRATHDFDEIIIDSRGEAEEILDYLGDLLERYDVVTVTDLYKTVGIRGSYMDDRWGWTDLRGSQARRVRDGYVLELPTPTDLDRRA